MLHFAFDVLTGPQADENVSGVAGRQPERGAALPLIQQHAPAAAGQHLWQFHLDLLRW